MRYTGSIVHDTPDPGTKEIKVKNKPGMWVAVPSSFADTLKPYELYVNKAGKIVMQNLLGKKQDLGLFCEHRIVWHVRVS